MLQEIVAKYKKKSWLRVCTLNNIHKWDLVDYIGEPVYASRYLIKSGFEIDTRVCLMCGKELALGIFKGTFIAVQTCKCSVDNTKCVTIDKLCCVFSRGQATDLFNLINTDRRKGLPNTMEYWLRQGYDVDQAKTEVTKIQKSRSSKSPAAQKGARGYSVRTTEYWIKRGLSKEEAIDKIKQIQITNGLSFYTARYGAAGAEMFNARIDKWLNSDGNKKMISNRSKKSIELFEQLGTGNYGPDEKTVRGKQKVHRVDFLHEHKIIEFYGDYWHGNPNFYSNDALIRKKKITDVWAHDSKKIQDLLANGYDVLIVWENEYKMNPAETIQKCKDFIQC